VVIRDNGNATYFASDIAYHAEKFERGFTRVLDIWGADHHGYIPLMRAALAALGIDVSGVDPAAWASPVMGHGRVVGEVRVTAGLG